jgi:hypothetical protein
MFKNDFNGMGGVFLCDKCRVSRSSTFRPHENIEWIRIESPHRKSHGNGRMLDFCTHKCLIVFFKGKKYWARKKKYQQENFERLLRLSEKCL